MSHVKQAPSEDFHEEIERPRCDVELGMADESTVADGVAEDGIVKADREPQVSRLQ